MGRKVNAFSKDQDYLEFQLTLAFAYYHFVVPHRGLRQRLPHPIPTKGHNGSPKKWRPVTPAMAAGLTDHVWTMDELLSFRVPPDALWQSPGAAFTRYRDTTHDGVDAFKVVGVLASIGVNQVELH